MPYTRQQLFAFSQTLWSVHNRNTITDVCSDDAAARFGLSSHPSYGSDPEERFLYDLIASHLRHDLRSLSANPGLNPKYFDFQLIGLTARECEVMDGLALGLSDSEIGMRLSCATKTVGKHVEHILAKLGAETRLAAVWTAQERLRAQNR